MNQATNKPEAIGGQKRWGLRIRPGENPPARPPPHSSLVRRAASKRRHGLGRCRYKGYVGMNRWVGLGVIAITSSTSVAPSRSRRSLNRHEPTFDNDESNSTHLVSKP
jgi:hypothetical protein